ncbi:MAG: RNA polymerase subunit sigma-24 [Planctomycetes bacterium]|nr:RNA polymerase subunit sigma-24 [Planctomycetota bacterium]
MGFHRATSSGPTRKLSARVGTYLDQMASTAASPERRYAARFVSEELDRTRKPGAAVRDQDLIDAILGGDVAAFEGLVARHERQAFWVAFHVVGRVEEARDVVQEAFLRVFKSLDRFDFAKNFQTWLYTIVTNLAIDALRKHRRGTTQLDEDAWTPPEDDEQARPDRALQQKEQAGLVHEVLDGLPENLRAVLALRDLQGISCREIAPIVGATYSTVRWRLARARQLFRERFEREGLR